MQLPNLGCMLLTDVARLLTPIQHHRTVSSEYVSSKEVDEPVAGEVRQFHLRVLVKKLAVSHSIERLSNVDSVND